MAEKSNHAFVKAAALSIAVIAVCGAAGNSASAGETYITTPANTFRVNGITSLRERRFREVVRQHYDYSCGAAAVATLLTFSYDRPTGEFEPFRQMILHGDKARIQTLGFSMLDMKNFMESLGYTVGGFRMKLDALQRIRVPAIALVEVNGYKHFIVIRAVNDRDVLFADPAVGMKIMSRERFGQIWDGVALVIKNDIRLAQAGFNDEEFLKVRPRAPLGQGVAASRGDMSIYSQTLFMRNLF